MMFWSGFCILYTLKFSNSELVCGDAAVTALDLPLYEDAKLTTRDALLKYIRIFINKAWSKDALSEVLMSTKSILPTPNNLPVNYKQVRTLIQKELLTLHSVDLCINDCMMFNDNNSECRECLECQQPRYKVDRIGREVSVRKFHYVDIEQFLVNMFGCSNIAKILQECPSLNDGDRSNNLVCDIQQTELWKQWKTARCEEYMENKVILGLNTDGVNPFHSHTSSQYSFWPLIFCIYNLPKHLRTKPEALLLFGIMPSRKDRLGKGVEPNIAIYQNLLVSQLLKLVSTELYSAYSQAPVKVKVELMLYLTDIQAYSNYFNMSGAVSYMPCHLCLSKASSSTTSNKRIMLGHDNYNSIQSRDYNAEVGEKLAGQIVARFNILLFHYFLYCIRLSNWLVLFIKSLSLTTLYMVAGLS